MYKALTVVNLPYVNEGRGKKFQPGEQIKIADLDASVSAGREIYNTIDPNFELTRDTLVQELIDFGSISEDLDEPILKEHEPVDPGAPTIERIIYEAQQLVERLGDSAPDEVKTLASLDYVHVTASEGGDSEQRAV